MSSKIDRYKIELSKDPIEPSEGLRFVLNAKCGAINSFFGIVRDLERTQAIKALYYEAYEPMARKQVSHIVEELLHDDSIECLGSRAYVAIRLGEVLVEQTSIYICVSSRGRNWSHRVTLEILNKIKSSVVIWKKAMFCDGREEWIDESKSEAWWLK